MDQNLIRVGTSNFRKLVSSDGITADLNRLFIDKTLFIKDFIDHSNDVILITRPRRWGKSSILSMLQHFFTKELEGLTTKGLFENLKIAQYLKDPKYQKYQGSYPIILITFKNLKGNNFIEIREKVQKTIAKLYRDFQYILDSDLIDRTMKEIFIKILEEKGSNADLTDSLRFLTELLTKYHNNKVFVLIDEYDNAINEAFNNANLLTELTDFGSALRGACLKDNDSYLEKGLVTGILRVAKANIFSGLNNPTEETILDYKFSDYYGFTEEEVNKLLKQANILDKQAIKEWYNGYIVGNNTVYNPWSIMQCIDHNGDLELYWVNSANPEILKDLLINKSSLEDKQKIRNLIKYKETKLEIALKKQVAFEDLHNNPSIIWSLLIHTGYLTLININDKYNVRLPNKEVALLIKDYIDNWFIERPFLSKTANSLLIGDFIKFEEALKEIFSDPAYSARIFSGGGRSAKTLAIETAKEFMYQFLIMTELRCINLAGNSEIEAFAEIEDVSQGKTRPDLLVVNHKQKLCVVGEIKVSFKENEDLNKIAKEIAIQQINRNNYAKLYTEKYGYKILKLGIAFRGDNFGIAYE